MQYSYQVLSYSIVYIDKDSRVAIISNNLGI